MRGNTARGVRDQGRQFPVDALIAELSRRIENVVRVGTVSQVDYKAGKARVKFGDSQTENELETHWIPWATGNSANNRTWSPPEVGEQVNVFSPSGNLANGTIHGAIPKADYPLDGDSPDISKRTFRNAGKDTIAAMDEFNRKTGVRRFHIKEDGSFRWEIGGKASIIMDGSHIQLQVGNTQIHITEAGISLLVNGNACSLVMAPAMMTSQVAGASTVMTPEAIQSVAGTVLSDSLGTSPTAITPPETVPAPTPSKSNLPSMPKV